MAKRTRVTTSVSTLVNDLSYLNDLCRVANRKDLLKGMSDLTIRTNKLVAEYESLRAEVDNFKVVIMTPVETKEEAKVEA